MDEPSGWAGIRDELRRVVAVAGRPDPRLPLAGRMRHYRVPGVGLALAVEGEIVLAAGYGEARAGEPVTPETRFQAGSISKPVAAVAALRLADQGRLRLDEDVNRRLSTWRLPDHPYEQPVTLRRLLSHNAGLGVTGFPGYPAGAALPTTRQILDGRPPANTAPVRVVAEPGSVVRYSGGGFTVVQQLVEDVAGTPFADAVEELVLEPAGMRRSTFVPPLPTGAGPGASDGHRPDGGPVDGGHRAYPEGAAAGLWSTPSDLVRFAIALQDARAGRGGLLRRETATEMLTPRAGIYGLGLRIEGTGADRWFWHTGGAEGFRAHLRGAVGDGRAVVVMGNGDDAMGLIGEVLEAVYGRFGRLAGARRRAAVAAVDPAPYAGRYRYELEAFSHALALRAEAGALRAAAPTLWAGERVWLPESRTRFFAPDGGVPIEMALDAAGRVEGLRWGSYAFAKVG